MDEKRGRVAFEQDGATARITLDDAERGNALDAGVIEELLQAVRAADDSGSAVIVLASTGRYFSVGGDLQAFAGADDMGLLVDDLAESLHRLVSELVRSRAVVVAAVQGPAAGAGVSLAAAADVVIASSDSSFTLAYTSVGLSHDGGSSMLVHTLGLHRALRMALLNDRLSAQEARDAGLVARVVTAEALDATVEAVVASIASGAGEALAAAKALMRNAAEPHPESVMRAETLSIRQVARGDGVEGVRAFLAKRTPVFTRVPRR